MAAGLESLTAGLSADRLDLQNRLNKIDERLGKIEAKVLKSTLTMP